MTTVVGMRVVRGPDWEGEDSDGGEAHVGTVLEVLGEYSVRVLWDTGVQSTCRAGRDGKLDLRIFDTATVGVCHPGSTCSVCDEVDVAGMLWRCVDCRNCTLCPACYSQDHHQLHHRFSRVDMPGSCGVPVKSRKTSVNIRSIGMFPGAKVVRGRDWIWGEQDGGVGSKGEVEGFEKAPDSCRNILRVRWPNGATNGYRLGYKGHVDLLCVEEEVGPSYYRDHLPLLDVRDSNSLVKTPSSPSPAATTILTGRSEALSIISKDTKQTAQHPVNACQDLNAHAIVSSDEDNEEEEMSVNVGDSVAVAVGEDELVDLQKKFGGCTQRMKEAIGVTGEVVRVSKGGSVYVNFIPMGQYRFNPKALVKVIQVREGQLVRIRPDKDQVKILNRRVGWKDEMTNTVGQVGRVIKLDEKGVVAISFGNSEFCYTYTKACCLPAHGAPQDSHNCGTSGRDTKLFPVSVVLLCGSEYIAKDEDSKTLSRALKEEGNNTKEESASVTGSRGLIHSLFVAIETGDRVTVSRLCRANRELLESAWNRMSPLMAACTYGHLKIVKLLLNLGANVSRIFGLYRSPLGAALEANRKEENICILLIERGADVRVVDGLDRSYMHIAATHDLPNVIGVLAARGADVNARDKHLDTPLHNAVQRKNHRAMEALLEVKGIDVRAKNRLDYTALHLASQDGCTRTVKKILALDASGVDDLHYKEETALHLAAMSGHADVIRLLVIDGKADINLRNDERLSQTPLHYTCAKANFKAAEALMELGADINHQDCLGNSPLHLAVSYWSKAEVDLRSESTRREYHARVAIGCMLISKGAYVDTKSKKGFDPFHFGLLELRESVKRFMKHNQHLIRCKNTSHAVDPGLFRLVSPSASPNKRESFLWVKCGICTASRSQFTFLTCKHKRVCNKCSSQGRCPICPAASSDKHFTGPDD